jgi:hypothetical protein
MIGRESDMNSGCHTKRTILAAIFVLALFIAGANGQADEICSEFGITPSLDSPFAHIPYVFGRVVLKGFDPGAKPPKVTIALTGQQSTDRQILGKSGNYCFRIRGTGGSLLVEVNGVETARRSLPSIGGSQQREDFDIYSTASQRTIPPGTISAKFSHSQNDKTIELYKKAAEAEKRKDVVKAVGYLKEAVSIDAADFIGWAKLGSLYYEQNSLPEAEAAFRRSLEQKVEYTPAWIYVGRIRVAQKQFGAAIEIFKHAASLDSISARTFQLLGEAYLQARLGTLGVQALNEAIRLDPIDMAECHLQLAHLYQLAGAKQMAAKEYRIFLEKVPDHPDKKKFAKFIKENP